ncbi:SDR family NAD(P)-dependent oxidoreductase [Nocardioides sp. BP30]|uniref:SDR family NAD(P)-dependent oxidoreductase n=1 Tax=Nocardioides sp. BP30 TaxID=3036374 RepID=UPI0024689933|nr:SDR family oxidoreductase [Nocardioides sp. BP30]WGL51421.1 SDR family NAD(P)-dependent oxidoreductase [Nocardioides sp. BP30]
MSNSFDFTDRSVLVTGSTGGIGRAIAEAFAEAGAAVIVTGRDADRGAHAVEVIKAHGGDARFIRADLGRGGSAIDALVDEALERVGRLDVLVNNAAQLITPSASVEVSQELIDEAFAVSVRAPFLLTGRIATHMAQHGGGAVVNLGSLNGFRGSAGSALYSATKATMHSLTKSWAAEYGPQGVRVNAVAPGPTLTEKVRAMQDYLAPMIAAMPSRRPSELAEVAAAVMFLASDLSSNTHGAILSVDGGAAAL